MKSFNSANTDLNLLNCMYGYFVKYDILSQLINRYFANSNANIINIYIDIDDIARSVSNYIKTPNVPNVNDPIFFSAGIINMCAHYREFFRKFYNTHAKFWIINSTNLSFHSAQYKDYSKYPSLDNEGLKLLNDNLEILDLLCQYIPDIQVIMSNGFDFGVLIASISEVEHIDGNNNPNLVISKDIYSYLLCSEVPNTFILRPFKNKSNDESYIISNFDCLSQYIYKLTKNSLLSTSMLQYGSAFMGIFMALTRCPSRNIKNRCRIDVAKNGYINALDAYHINDKIFDIDTFLNLTNIKNINPFEIKLRYQALDIMYMKGIYDYSSIPKYKGIINLYDPEGVKRINNTYFKNLPLDLEVL